MAKISQGAFGPFSGKVGNLIGTSFRGTAVIKSRPQSVRNPKTPAQVRVRTLFAIVSSHLKPFLTAIRHGFVNTGKVPEWSAAVKSNYNQVRDTQNPTDPADYHIIPSKLILTNGGYNFPITISSGRDNVFSLTWDEPEPGDTLYGANVHLAVYNTANGRVAHFSAPSDSGSASFSAAGIATGSDEDIFHAYAFAATSSAASSASYLEA